MKALICGLATFCAWEAVHAQSQQTPAEVNADITRNGPYAQRQFARRVGPAISLPTPTVETVPGTLMVDAATKETNEVIVRLNYSNSSRLAQIASTLAAGATAPQIERAFMSAVASRSPNADFALASPLNVRYLIASDRMSDADRVRRGKTARDDDPRERLERYLVVRYSSVELARQAAQRMSRDAMFEVVHNNMAASVSSAPNDAYFPPDPANPGTASYYQWGLHAMNFPAAWDNTAGQSYIGVMDQEFPGTATGTNLAVHPDLQKNFRQHMLSVPIQDTSLNPQHLRRNHTIHVSGIIAAQQNNATPSGTGWVAGACPECSFVTYPLALSTPDYSSADVAARLTEAVDGGMQVVNWSGAFTSGNCGVGSRPEVCDALRFATGRGVLVVIAAGNVLGTSPQFPGDSETIGWNFTILPVGGISPTGSPWVTTVPFAQYPGTNWASQYGVMGPAESVVSTFTRGEEYNSELRCADNGSFDTSAFRFAGGMSDEVGTCTGTSMAAPHISALAGLVISVNPRMTAADARNIIRQSGNSALSPSAQSGYGLPNANVAVNVALAGNPTRLTPLFSYYSPSRQDSFYTTAPQMAHAAAYGKMLPAVPGYGYSVNAYSSTYYGTPITGYLLPQGSVFGGDTTNEVTAQVWIFTTSANPKIASAPLRPIFRMSWKCGDTTPITPAICSTIPYHLDSVLVGKDEVAYFASLGYKVDGLEGYVYPPDQAQPTGTVRLMRKYNPARDDHASFPDTATSTMTSQGYTSFTNTSDWLGYVYPNTGTVPTIQ